VTAAANLNQLTTQLRFDGLKNAIDEFAKFNSIDLHQIIAGVRAFLVKMQDALLAQTLQELPLVGTVTDPQDTFIGKIIAKLDALDAAIKDFQGGIGQKVADLRQWIYNNLGPDGLKILDPSIKSASGLDSYIDAKPKEGVVLFKLPLKGMDTFHASFDLGLNALAFGFNANAGVKLTLQYQTVLGFGYNLKDGFYIAVNPNATYLPGMVLPDPAGAQPEMQFQVTAALDPGSSLEAQLFFLHVTATNSMQPGATSLSGTVFVDLIDPNNDGKLTWGELTSANQLSDVFNAGINTEAKANLALQADVKDYPELPNVSAGFLFDWGLGYSIRTGVVGGGLPLVQFTNLQLDLGSFLAKAIQPFLVDFNKYAQPIKPLIQFLNTEVPGLSDVSKQAGKGPITYLQLGVLLANGPSGVNADAYRRAEAAQRVLNLVTQAFQFAEDASQSNFQGTPEKPLLLNFGTFTFGGPVNNVNLADKNTTVSADQATETGTADTLQTALEKAAAANDPNGALLATLTRAPDGSGNNGLGISLPFLKNPSLLMKMFTGETADLVTWDIPPLVLNLPFYQQFGPLFGLPLFATVGVNFTAFLDLHLGFDTRGLAPPAGSVAKPVDTTSGSTATDNEPTTFDKFANGFYFGAPINPQTNLPFPVFGLTLDVAVGVKLDSYVASVGAEGAIIGQIALSWNDNDRNGKVYLDELINIVGNGVSDGNPFFLLAVFNAQGSLTAVLRITYRVFFFSGKYDLINQTLFSIDTRTGTVYCSIC
jgi:hypothetical protein